VDDGVEQGVRNSLRSSRLGSELGLHGKDCGGRMTVLEIVNDVGRIGDGETSVHEDGHFRSRIHCD
jgi:hypothetical protein